MVNLLRQQRLFPILFKILSCWTALLQMLLMWLSKFRFESKFTPIKKFDNIVTFNVCVSYLLFIKRLRCFLKYSPCFFKSLQCFWNRLHCFPTYLQCFFKRLKKNLNIFRVSLEIAIFSKVYTMFSYEVVMFS